MTTTTMTTMTTISAPTISPVCVMLEGAAATNGTADANATLTTMSFLSTDYEDASFFYDGANASQNISDSADYAMGPEQGGAIDHVTFAISRVLTPLFCGFGIVGNILNILVLTRRRMQSGSDSGSERAAFMGLIALACSDLFYCISAFPKAFLPTQIAFFLSGDPKLYYYLYESYILNSFSKISTWLTVIMAVSRFVAICHPLHSRIFVHFKGTFVAIALTFVIWFLLELPECWTHSVMREVCPRETYIFLDTGIFLRDTKLKVTFQYLWFTLGFVVPVCILAFCNIQLIRALRASARMRQECRVHGGRNQPGNRITPTLVAIVLMFIFLMTPSEIINFTAELNTSGKHHTLIVVITNLMNTINFSVNFILYCVVNVHFRSTLLALLCGWRRRKSGVRRALASNYSAITSQSNLNTEENAI